MKRFLPGLAAVGLVVVVARGVASAPSAPSTPWPSGPVVWMLGINEAVSFPARRLATERPSREILQARLDADALAAAALGATWTRGHTVAFPALPWNRFNGDFSRFDAWVQAVQGAGLEAVGMLGPWPGNRTQQFTDRFVPEDMAGYLAYVTALVERYDLDGVDDMPRLKTPIRHWEVDNEPDLKNTGNPKNATPTQFCTPAEYATLLVATASAIRAASPEARILNGGFYRPATDVGADYARAVFAQPGVVDAVDIVSVHAYHEGPGVDRVRKTLALARELAADKPVWLTETSVPSTSRRSSLGEAGQARVYQQTILLALREGVEKVFWHTLFDPPAGVALPRGAMASHSFYRRQEDGSLEEKPLAASAKKLAGWLAGVDWSEVQPEGEGVRLGAKGLLTTDSSTGSLVLKP